MSVTTEQLADWLNVDPADPSLPDILALAGDLVNDYCEQWDITAPTSAMDFAIKEVASRAWDRKKSPNGAVQFSPDGSVFYQSADLLKGVTPTLDRYRSSGLGIA